MLEVGVDKLATTACILLLYLVVHVHVGVETRSLLSRCGDMLLAEQV